MHHMCTIGVSVDRTVNVLIDAPITMICQSGNASGALFTVQLAELPMTDCNLLRYYYMRTLIRPAGSPIDCWIIQTNHQYATLGEACANQIKYAIVSTDSTKPYKRQQKISTYVPSNSYNDTKYIRK